MKRVLLTAIAGMFGLLSGIVAAYATDGRISPELADEAKMARAICEENTMLRAMMDCDCSTRRFTEERLAGNAIHINNLINDIGKDCPNGPGIAELEYRWCMKAAKQFHLVTHEETDPVCRCSAEKAAKRFVDRPAMSTRALINYAVGSRVECGTGKFRRLNNDRRKELAK